MAAYECSRSPGTRSRAPEAPIVIELSCEHPFLGSLNVLGPFAPVKAESRSSNVGDEALRLRLFAPFFGAFLGLSLLKFGNPPIMEKWVTPPADIYEFVLAGPWPIGWAYTFLGFLVIFGLFATRPQVPRHLWLVVLP